MRETKRTQRLVLLLGALGGGVGAVIFVVVGVDVVVGADVVVAADVVDNA